MASYRKFFSENYIAEQQPADNKKGYKVKYEYAGLWYIWDFPYEIRNFKILFFLMALLNWVTFACCGSQAVKVNYFTPLEIMALFSVVLLLFETIGIGQFIYHKDRMTEYEFRDVSNKVRYCSLAHGVLLIITVCTGIYFLIRTGFSIESSIVLIGYSICGIDSLLINRIYRSFEFHSEKSELMKNHMNGNVSDEEIG